MLFFSACNKSAKVLSEKQMENVLFDIHIADAEISNNFNDFRDQEIKKELYASVLKKHKITQEQFDTSLVWYGRNLDKYVAIYNKLNNRYTVLSDSITAKIDRQKAYDILFDSTKIYIWEGPKILMLNSLPSNNLITFNLDTILLSPKQDYEFRFTTLGIMDSISGPLVTFGVVFPDSTLLKRERVTSNGLFSIDIPSKDTITTPNRLFGSIRLTPTKSDAKVVIYDIGLFKKNL